MARLEQELNELAYRVYVTDSLRLMPQRKYAMKRFYEVINPPKYRNGDEIAKDIIERAGLKVIA